MHLSNHNWDLLVCLVIQSSNNGFAVIPLFFVFCQAAVQHVTPQHTQHLPSEVRNMDHSVMIADDFVNMAPSTSQESHLLTIEIEQNGHVITVISFNPDSKTTIGNCCNSIYTFYIIELYFLYTVYCFKSLHILV